MIGKLILKKIFGVPDKKEFFCRNKSHHASQRCVPRWDFFVYMHMEYANLPLGTANLLANLQNGGLAIMD